MANSSEDPADHGIDATDPRIRNLEKHIVNVSVEFDLRPVAMFQCPACSKAYMEVRPKVVKKLSEEGAKTFCELCGQPMLIVRSRIISAPGLTLPKGPNRASRRAKKGKG